MCRRLGIRQAFSHAHRPQANGRAEMAGKQVITILRKLNAENEINWVEALPHALRIHHDTPGPTGWSPYEIVFGRPRSLANLPSSKTTLAEDAEEFFQRMEDLGKKIATTMNAMHEAQEAKINSQRKEIHKYNVGDKVWVMRPKPLGGHKIQPWWAGPYPIVGREGEQSFVLQWNDLETLRVHADQLKPWRGDEMQGSGISMTYRHTDPHDVLPMKVAVIRGYREGPCGLEFLIHWEGSTPVEDTWEPTASFVHIRSREWRDYCDQHQIPISLAPPPSARRRAPQ